jgi:hypothetical protein
MKNKKKLPRIFQIGDEVMYDGRIFQITAAQFTESKVYYTIVSNNECIGFVDSIYVSSVEKQEVK